MDNISAMAIASKKSEDSFYTFARDNHRFIIKCACVTCRRLITESDDEWSIALVAFYEAVKKYDEEKGRFASYAKMVISSRLKDYFDRESRIRLNEKMRIRGIYLLLMRVAGWKLPIVPVLHRCRMR